MNQYWRLLTYC